MKEVFYFFLFFLIAPYSISWSQTPPIDDIKTAAVISNTLAQEGFQNISVGKFEDNYVIGYENRVYRFDPMALKKVITLTTDLLLENAQKAIFITKRNNVSLLSTEVFIPAYKKYKQGFLTQNLLVGNITTSQNIKKYKRYTTLSNNNTGNYKFELVVRPYLSVELGSRAVEDQFIHLIDLRPKLNFYLWKGAHFTYEFIVPISNEFKKNAPHWSHLRPRIISFTQQVRLPYNTFLQTSVGLFSRDRYGGTVSMSKYFFNGRLLTTGKVGYTGHASYVRYDPVFNQVNKNWGYTNLDYLDYKIGIHYWFANRNFQAGIEYGKVLNNQNVIRFQSWHKFKEVDIGFFLYKTNEGTNYGIQLGIPIFPKKYMKNKLFSIRPTRRFRYEYLSHTFLAREYQAQGMHEDFFQDIHPAFMQFQLQKGLD